MDKAVILHQSCVVLILVLDVIHVSEGVHGWLNFDGMGVTLKLGDWSLSVVLVSDNPVVNVPNLEPKLESNRAIDKELE